MPERIVFPAPNRALLEAFDPPHPRPGEALVRIEYSLISTGTESKAFAGAFEAGTHWSSWVKYPFYPGYTVVGVVTAVGDDADTGWIGQRVCTSLGHSSQGTVDVSDLISVPDGIGSELAPWAKIAQIAHTGVDAAGVTLGAEVLVIGAGPIGQMTLRWAVAAGAHHVTVADPSTARHPIATMGGATAMLNGNLAESRDDLMSIHAGHLPALVIDTTGNPAVLHDALGVTAPHGTLALVGDPGEPSKLRLPARLTTAGLHVVGVHHSHGFSKQADVFKLFFDLVTAGRISVDGLNTHRFAPNDAQEAYQFLQDNRDTTMGVLFEWTTNQP